MKVIFKQNKIETIDAIKVNVKDINKILYESDKLQQKLVKVNGKLILRSHEIDNCEAYSSILDIDVYVQEGDILLDTGEGYTKPIRPVIELSSKEIKAINNINEVL